jgi:ribonuclease PH
MNTINKMRKDGRKFDEIRHIGIIKDFTIYAEGSVLYCLGNTKVLCTLTVEEGTPRWKQNQNIPGGWLTAEYSMLPRSTHQRTTREINSKSGRTMEIQRLVGRSLRSAINLEILGNKTLTIDCDVLQADGGTRIASINGGYLALVLGLKKMINEGLLPPEVLKSPVAAVSVGKVKGDILLDLCYEEDSIAEVDANFVMNENNDLIEVQSTAEGKPYSIRVLNQMTDVAQKGIVELLKYHQNFFKSE